MNVEIVNETINNHNANLPMPLGSYLELDSPMGGSSYGVSYHDGIYNGGLVAALYVYTPETLNAHIKTDKFIRDTLYIAWDEYFKYNRESTILITSNCGKLRIELTVTNKPATNIYMPRYTGTVSYNSIVSKIEYLSRSLLVKRILDIVNETK